MIVYTLQAHSLITNAIIYNTQIQRKMNNKVHYKVFF